MIITTMKLHYCLMGIVQRKGDMESNAVGIFELVAEVGPPFNLIDNYVVTAF